MKKIWSKSLHKYVGVALCFFLLLSALSGIIINHRALWAEIDVPRWLLPKGYQIQNWNNAALRGCLRTSRATFLYGYGGVWITDSALSQMPTPCSEGFVAGADEQKVVAMAEDAQGGIWAASQFHVYRLAPQKGWCVETLPDTLTERLTDLYAKGDSLIVLTRSHVILRVSGHQDWKVLRLPPSQGHEWGTLLFQIVWTLHSGEFFGTAGKVVVDLLGILLIAISLTGLYFFLLRHRKQKGQSAEVRRRHGLRLQKSLRWHKVWGWRLLLPLLFVVVTGWALRPPVMLAFVFHRAEPWKYSCLYSDNPWHERFRAIRYDKYRQEWLLSTSTGFYSCKELGDEPRRWEVQPPMSPMGINAFEQQSDGSWLIGSFSGMFEVRPEGKGQVVDFFTRKVVDTSHHSRPVADYAVSGILMRPAGKSQVVLYDTGIVERTNDTPYFKESTSLVQPEALSKTPFSLWQYALEVHTGRIYVPFIGKIGTELFTFIFGGCTILVLLTGWWRMKGKQKKGGKTP